MKTFNFIAATFFTLFLLWALGWLWFATNIALSKPEASNKKTEAIVVLTGGNGRITAGLQLLKDDYAPKLFISGVHQDTTQNEILANKDVPSQKRKSRVELGHKAKDTVGNARETKEWVEENNIKSIRLVTYSYHLPRAMQEIKDALPTEIEIIAHPVFTDDFESWQGRFWSLTFGEYNKTILRKLELVLKSDRKPK